MANFTIEKIGKRTRPYYVFEDGEFYAMFKTLGEATLAIGHATDNRLEELAVEAVCRAERAAKIEARLDRKAAQPQFSF